MATEAASGNEALKLEQLGLPPTQARAYLTLLSRGPMGAPVLADLIGVTRTSAYTALRALVDLGLVEAGAGYASRFHAAPPEEAFPALIDRRRIEIYERMSEEETLAKALVLDLSRLVSEVVDVEREVVEVIRSPRSVGERYSRLQDEAQESVEVLVKAPIVTNDGNPAGDAVLERGLTTRAIYESDVLAHDFVRPYLQRWVEAGEQTRIYEGSLPLKFALFDREVVLMPLHTPQGPYPMTSLLIRHAALGAGLAMLFDNLWQNSRPFGE